MADFCITGEQKRMLLRILNDRVGVLDKRHEIQTRDDYSYGNTASSEERDKIEALIEEVEKLPDC